MLTREQLTGCFAPVTQPYQSRVGFEYEAFCFRSDTLEPLTYHGPRGLAAVLEAATRLGGGEMLAVEGDLTNKVRLPDHGLLSLEPGGQLEFSSAPKGRFQSVVHQLDSWMALLNQLAEQFELKLFFGGVSPVHRVDDIGLVVPTKRYRIMDRYFPTVGTMGQRMMRQSASVQVSFDYKDRQQGANLLRAAQYICPFAAALFANAPYVDGRPSGYRSFRAPIWAHTDRARSGALPGFTRPDYGFDDYLDHVLQAPMFFVRHGQELVPAQGLTFGQFMEQGHRGRSATLEDFQEHNSTIFTDVRLKHTVEVRTVDCQHPSMTPAVLAFLSGLLFCDRSRKRALHLLQPFTEPGFHELSLQLARGGLATPLGQGTAQEVMLELIDLAARGLPACFPDGADATDHLRPIRELAERGLTPADLVLERHGDDARAWLAEGNLGG